MDESRQRRPSRQGMGPLVAVGGIALPGEGVRSAEAALEELCKAAGFPTGQEFKWSPGRELWMREHLIGPQRREFFEKVLQVVADHAGNVTVIVEDFSCMCATDTSSPETDVARLYLERAHRQLDRFGVDGIVIADRPGGNRSSENRFLLGCLETLQKGTDYVKPKRFALNVLASPSRFVRLLQAADLVTACTLAAVSGERTYAPPIFEKIKPLLDRAGGRIGGIGLKIHPDFKYMNLYHWLVDDSAWMRGWSEWGLPKEGQLYLACRRAERIGAIFRGQDGDVVKQRSRPLDRYPYEVLGVADIAEQAYCEKRVGLWLQDPGRRASVPRAMEGTIPAALEQEAIAELGSDFHEDLASAAAPMGPEEIAARLRAGETLRLVEFPLGGEYRGITIGGQPDATVLRGSKALCVLEYKTSDSNQLHMSHRVQLLLYGFLLAQQGFDVSDLLLVCVLVPRRQAERLVDHSARGDSLIDSIHEEARSIVKASPRRRNWYRKNFRLRRGLEVKLRVFRYDPKRAEDELCFFTAFWLGRRSARPTGNPKKCRVCLYNASVLCDAALVPYRARDPR